MTPIQVGDEVRVAFTVTCERFDDLWQAVLARCEELKPEGSAGSSRSASLIESDGRGVAAICSFDLDDGTSVVHQITARAVTRGRVIEVQHTTWLDSHDQFWADQMADREGAVVIDHCHYRIKPDIPRGDGGFAGYGGRLHRIRLASGDVIETRNLWYQGIVPPPWRERLPDDAEFVIEALAEVAGTFTEQEG